MPLRVITPATDEPVTLAMVKQNCRLEVNDTSQDGLLLLLLGAATDEFENQTSRQLCEGVWELVLPAFVAEAYLEKSPVQEVMSVKYYDESNVLQTMDAALYDVDVVDASAPGKVTFNELPATYERHDAVMIQFKAGYVKVPEAIQAALTAYVTQRYLSPGNNVEKLPTYFTKQCRNFRVWKQAK